MGRCLHASAALGEGGDPGHLLVWDDDEQPPLSIVARPQPMFVELEFVATTRQETIEDRLAHLSDEAPIPTVDDLSLRLLWCHTSAVLHQRFHGVDIVTVQVEADT